MAIIPSNTQFIGDTTGIPIQELRSAQINALSGAFTMSDIADSAVAETEVTYSELLTLANNNELTPGKRYLITDNQTICYIPKTTVKNTDNNDNNVGARQTVPVEPIIVQAFSTSELQKQAYSLLYPNDIIYYTLDSSWYGILEVPGETKGAITYREVPAQKLGFGISTPYSDVSVHCDFRHIFLRSWELDMTNINGNTAAGNYLLFDQSVTCGKAFAANANITYVTTGPANYIDTKIFNETKDNQEVKIEFPAWWEGHSIPNTVFFGIVASTYIATTTYSRMDMDVNRMSHCTLLEGVIVTRQYNNTKWQTWFGQSLGTLTGCFIAA